MDMEYLNIEMELIPILLEMSYRGLLIDQEARRELELRLEKEVKYYQDLCEGEGFNPGSPQQVAYILAKRGAYSVLPRIPFTKGYRSISTEEKVLNKMDDPMAAIVLNYRTKSKLLNTYIKPWGMDERAYCRYHLDAITGRPSSTNRNMQNIPAGEPRGVFIPDDGVWTDIDFSQVELRTLAYLAGDREMQYIFESGGDIHQYTADFLGIERKLAKNTNFAIIYGATDETLAETAGIRNIARARELKERWFRLYVEAGDWAQERQLKALEYPYARTVFGRNIRLPTLEEEDSGGIMRKAVNYPIQGSASEVLKRALIMCKELPMALTVHDEILFDGKVELPNGLEHIAPFYTPISVKYLQRWE
jgi:DNA polymerase-1